MPQSDEFAESPPPEGTARALEVAAWHLQVLLTSLAGFDGKIMFLTALNVAGGSALIGVAATSDPSVWLLGTGLSVAGVCIALGLRNLWAANIQQFSTPREALRIARDATGGSEMRDWQYFLAIQLAVRWADDSLRRRVQLMRILLVGTPVALALAAVTALTATQ